MSTALLPPRPAPAQERIRAFRLPTQWKVSRPRTKSLAVLTAVALVLPSLVWAWLDREVWFWDQAWYGQGSVELYQKLVHDPRHWIQAVLSALGPQAPGITWFGQLFVPLGRALGSVDLGLFLSVLVVQVITLLLVFKTGRAFFRRHGRLPAVTGCLLVRSRPLLV